MSSDINEPKPLVSNLDNEQAKGLPEEQTFEKSPVSCMHLLCVTVCISVHTEVIDYLKPG